MSIRRANGFWGTARQAARTNRSYEAGHRLALLAGLCAALLAALIVGQSSVRFAAFLLGAGVTLLFVVVYRRR